MENLKDRVTIYQVAQAAGVSLATVSRVINKQGNVTEATRARVEETIKRLGYKPSGLAQALATNKTTNIGVVIPSANYVYISNMLNGISEIAKQKGFVLTLFTTSHSREEALSMIEKVITTHVDGTIIFDDELEEEDIMKIASYNVPSIVVNNQVSGDRTGCVLFGFGDIIKSVINDYYYNNGKKPMTFLHVHDGGRMLAKAEKIFVETNERLNKPYNIINVDDSYNRTYHDFLEYFQHERSGYFFAYRDSIAAAVENAATDNGLRVPHAKDKETGKEQSIKITTSSGLSEADIERMKKDAEANAEKDKADREREDAKNRAEQTAYQAEKQLKELGDKIPADTKSQLEAAIQEIKDKKENGTKEEIDAAINKLQSMISSMAGAAQGGPSAETSSAPHASEAPKGNGKEDGPIDADYTVVDDDKKK